MSPPPPEPGPPQFLPAAAAGAPAEAETTDSAISIVDLPDQLLPAPTDSEERWEPLPGVAGMEIESLARAALGDLVPPEAPLDFNLLDDEAPVAAAETHHAEAVTVPAEEPKADRAMPPAPAKQAELASKGRLEVACPTCSTTGFVPFDRLDGVLCCSGCWTWFRVAASGQLEVVDPPAASQGALKLYSRTGTDRTVLLKSDLLEEKSRAARRQRRWGGAASAFSGRRIGAVLMALVPIALLGTVLYLGGRWWSKPRVVKLPVELDRRARVFAESWLQRDTRVMVRLTHPNCRGITRTWAHDHQSPLAPGQFDRRRAAVDVRILHQDDTSADAEVRLDLSGLTGSPEPIVLRQHWETVEGNWMLKPSAAEAVQRTAVTKRQTGDSFRKRRY